MTAQVSTMSRNHDDEGRIDEQWARVRSRLQAEVGETEYRAWLREMSLAGVDGDEVTVRLPSAFLRDWVRSRYGDRLTSLWKAENQAVRRVDIRVGATAEASGAMAAAVAPVAPIGRDTPAATLPATAGAAVRTDEQGSALDPRFTFDSFVVGKPNEFAHACARRVADRPAEREFNPLFLYGGVGLGKTHLMHAIAWELGGKTQARPPAVAYMSSERFLTRFIWAIRNHATMEFKEQLRNVDVLMIDDLQFLIGKDATQEEFFHTFNALVDAGKQIVVSADKSPADMDGLGERVRTRLASGMVADLHAATFELRISILEAKAARSGAAVPHKVLEFLAHKITSNIRELEGALNRLVAHAQLFDRPVTLDATHEVLHDVLKAHDRRISIEEIQKRVAEHYHMRLADMTSARRSRSVARPRQIAMFLAKQLTSRSLPEIGRLFGNRDHTTVIHAVQRVTALMECEQTLADDVELLRRMLES